MKIVIPGGSGQVGTLLARAFHAEGHAVVVLTRHPQPTAWKTFAWDGATPGDWCAQLDGADAVINLAGRSVNCRYHTANRREIMQSRVDSTHAVGLAIAAARQPPRVWLQAGTATIYAHRYESANDEATGILGGDEPNTPDTWRFSIEVARAWERALEEASTPHTRKVILRSAMTMSPDAGGIFATLLGLVRRSLGGRAGDGHQFMSWIHDEDFIRAIRWIIARDDLTGPINLAAPHPVPNADFMRVLRQAAGVSFGLPAPAWLIEIGTRFLRTESELILKSRRVTPTRLLASGFTFHFPTWPEAARDLCCRWSNARSQQARPTRGA
ncbi:MAG: TIGR01777 family oxidoreductase [Chthoniobacter sp.]|nr:TIGR01777 family oxidoreductase [Chthoniobacter sp.]